MSTSSNDDLEARVTALELRTELRGHTSVLNALRETQLEQGEQIAELRGEVREGFAKMNVSMTQITALLTNTISDTDQ